jgi:hypothetical protein
MALAIDYAFGSAGDLLVLVKLGDLLFGAVRSLVAHLCND